MLEKAYEGYVAKDEDSKYVGGRTRAWLKVKQKDWTVEEDRWQRRISAVPRTLYAHRTPSDALTPRITRNETMSLMIVSSGTVLVRPTTCLSRTLIAPASARWTFAWVLAPRPSDRGAW